MDEPNLNAAPPDAAAVDSGMEDPWKGGLTSEQSIGWGMFLILSGRYRIVYNGKAAIHHGRESISANRSFSKAL